MYIYFYKYKCRCVNINILTDKSIKIFNFDMTMDEIQWNLSKQNLEQNGILHV